MNAIDSVMPLAQKKSLKITTDIKSSNIEINADPIRVQQIFINILSNAIKYTDEGSIIFSLRYDESNEPHLQFSVADTGVGINKEDQARLFKRFEQFDDTSRFKLGAGTGIGLAITAELVYMHEGRIDVQSGVGKGSTFTVCLPCEKQDKHLL